jgi:hypothetical protein
MSVLLPLFLAFCLVAISVLSFPTRTVVRTVSVPVLTTKVQTVTKVIEKFPDGKVVERYTTQTIDKTKASPQPKVPQYRAGILMQVGNDRLPTVSASKRLFSSVWADAQFDFRHKEATIGISYEF